MYSIVIFKIITSNYHKWGNQLLYTYSKMKYIFMCKFFYKLPS